jgi:hypothetical protein
MNIYKGFSKPPVSSKVLYITDRSISHEDIYLFRDSARYATLAALGDRLGEISGLIDWGAFRPLLADLYTNTEGRGVRLNYDVVLMIRLLVLQQWYGLSDPELERQATDRISFRHFLGYPEHPWTRSSTGRPAAPSSVDQGESVEQGHQQNPITGGTTVRCAEADV